MHLDPPTSRLGVMSRNLSFIYDCPIISKTVKYIDQSDNDSWHGHDLDTYRFMWLIAD